MNNLDIAVIVIIALLAIIGGARGFVRSCFSFVPSIVALVFTGKIYPYVSKFLMKTPLFDIVKNSIAKGLNINSAVSGGTENVVNSLSLPQFLKSLLIANNNNVVYNILNVSDTKDYIAGYIANICINIISMIIVVVGLIILFKLIIGMLDIITHLPVISTFNRIGGFAVGVCEGILIVWVLFIIAVLFCSSDKLQWFYTALPQSKIASVLFEKNILMYMISKVIT
ncbi:MAG: CvpA family protein [Clostridia bacterium]|nr:CvpA family protein [Clostridia bacterium]MCI2015976.1 CvpA family protein [Clostridia bacterium]